MCDYSLERDIQTRLAQQGDQLVTQKLGYHGTVGLVSPAAPNVAVCVVPGARLSVTVPESIRKEYGLNEVEVAVFDQKPPFPQTYRDGFRFRGSDEIVTLQRFPVGVSVEILSLEVREEEWQISAAAAPVSEIYC